jgi:integrase
LEAIPVSARTPRTPSYRHHKPSGQAVVTLGGRDIYLGPYGTKASKTAYDRAIAEWLAGGRRRASQAQLVIAELVPRYNKHVGPLYASNEPRNIRLALKPLRVLYGTTPACEIGPLALKAVRQTFVDSGLSRGEINKRTRRIVRFFKWAAAEELVDASVYQALKAVEGLKRGQGSVRESEPVKPVADVLVNAVKPHVSRQVCAMIELQRLTGMRPGEACMMRTCDINTQGRIWEYRPESHKTAHRGKCRVIFIGPQAQEILKPWLRTELGAYLFQPCESIAERRANMRANRKSRVQPSQQCREKAMPKRRPGERYRPDSYRWAIAKACEKAGVDAWHPHQLRHSAATRLRREFGLDVARAVLGHSSPVVTEVYAELDQAKAQEAMGKIG